MEVPDEFALRAEMLRFITKNGHQVTMTARNNDKYLNFRANPHSRLGKIITYLQNGDAKKIGEKTLETRFLPFVMEKDDPLFVGIAIQCAAECEAWARAIREYAQLSHLPSLDARIDIVPSEQVSKKDNLANNANQDGQTSEIIRQQNGEDLVKSMGLM